MRLAILSSHPIQYQAPLFRTLSRRAGVDLTVLFCDAYGVQASFDPEFGRVIRYDVPLLEGYDHRFMRNVAFRPAMTPLGIVNPSILLSLLRAEFDAMVVHGYRYATSLMALLGPRRRTRILFRGESHLLPRRGAAKGIGKQVILRTLFERVDHFLPIGTRNREYYASYGVRGDRMTVAPYSVDNEYFARGSAEARRDPFATRRRLGLPESVPLFLFAAKLIAKKRPFDALRAFAEVRARVPCGLVYVGDGALAGELETEIARLGLGRDVYRLGFRNQGEMPALYGACDALVLPSDDEPWGLVVNEAMACGMAVMASNHVGAVPDLVDPDAVFRVGDVRGLAGLMVKMASHPEDMARAKARSSEAIMRWGLESTADGFVRGVESALQGRQGRR